MKKAVLTLATILATFFATSQNITGQWTGKLNMNGNDVNVVFDIKGKGNNLNAKLYNAGQTKRGLEVDLVSFKDSIITLRITEAKIEFSGFLKSDSIFVGGLIQNNVFYSLELKKGFVDLTPIAKTIIQRPKGFETVYSYFTEYVVFESPSEEITMGKLSLPINKNNAPAIILYCGSETSSVENGKIIQTEKVFDYLSSCGLAVFRLKNPISQSSTNNGDVLSSKTTDLAAVTNYLKTRSEINPERIKSLEMTNCTIISQIIAIVNSNNLKSQVPDLISFFNESDSKKELTLLN